MYNNSSFYQMFFNQGEKKTTVFAPILEILSIFIIVHALLAYSRVEKMYIHVSSRNKLLIVVMYFFFLFSYTKYVSLMLYENQHSRIKGWE